MILSHRRQKQPQPKWRFFSIASRLVQALILVLLLASNFRSLPSKDIKQAEQLQNQQPQDPEEEQPQDPEDTDCYDLMTRFRDDEINVTKSQKDMDYHKSFVTVANKDTDVPFYVSTHDKQIDNIRSQIMVYKFYYERQLTKRVVEIFQAKRKKGEESIFLDVGANIGWFSLVAAMHGATKVYSFEPNLQNTVRMCESLSLNNLLRENKSQNIVVPISKGVGQIEGNLTLYATHGNNPGSFSFRKYDSKPVVGIMKITTLDLFAERHGWFDSRPSIGLLKLDVENFEKEVFKGAQKLFQSKIIENIVMELKINHRRKSKELIIKTLYKNGYEIYMHGGFEGPKTLVKKKYFDWNDLVEDIQNKLYGENILLTLKSPEPEQPQDRQQ